MPDVIKILNNLMPYFPLVGALFAVYILYLIIKNILRKNRTYRQNTVINRLVKITVVVITILAIIVTFPSTGLSDDIMTLFGILVSGAIAVSSATFIANTMSGLFLRSIRSFVLGDFIKVGEYFGRVSEKSFFHTEIQTEERHFVTLPNHYLINNPVTVLRKSGVVVSAKVSLSYDVPNHAIENILGLAAEQAMLEDPSVQILDLGDFSVTYRCSGILKDTKQYFSAQSLLRSKMLDQLHRHSVEIVSPNFMNQRIFDTQKRFIPDELYDQPAQKSKVELGIREDLVFDKAEIAISASELQHQLDDVNLDIMDLDEKIRKTEPGNELDDHHKALKVKLSYRNYIEKRLNAIKAKNGE